MKKTLITLAILSFVGIGMAQTSTNTPSPAHQGARAHRDFMKELNLTPDQQSQIKALIQANAPAQKAIREDASLTREQKQEQMKAIHAKTQTAIEAVLTPEQKTKLAALRKEQKP